MEKKLMWFFSLWLTLMIATITVQYLYTGSLNLAYLLGTTLGTAIVGWLFISGPRRRWIYWAGMVSWVLIVPSGFIVLIRFIASLLSVKNKHRWLHRYLSAWSFSECLHFHSYTPCWN